MKTSIFSFLLLCISTASLAENLTTIYQRIDQNHAKITLNFPVQETKYLYKNSLLFSIDDPDIIITSWAANRDPIQRYEETSKKTEEVFLEPIEVTVLLEGDFQITHDAALHVNYEYNDAQGPRADLIPLVWLHSIGMESQKPDPVMQIATEKKTVQKKIESSLAKNHPIPSFWRYSRHLSNILERTKSTPIRLILVFLLGILLSLTPCIYPMIPITIGVLQAQKSSSFGYNFLLAFSYTLGLATTFACLGLLVSFTGPIYGKLLMNPLSVLIIVSFLLYLAFSMFGFYELHIPRFLQPKSSLQTNGSLASAFIFGAMSGTIASPCVSPGLALLLSIVATLGSSILGFLLLFCFGVGLSTPLLIVGTFSNSISLLPRTGSWMIEIKKIFGIMLLMACVYYLSNVVPLHSLLFISTFILIFFGGYYLYHGKYHTATALWQTINNWIGIFFIALALVSLTQGLKQYYKTQKMCHNTLWLTNYEDALQKAHAEQKRLFIDFWAQFCSICISINNKVLNKEVVSQALKHVVPLSVDGTYDNAEPFNTLKKQYDITGFPTLLLVDAITGTVIKQWGSEVYHMPPELLAQEITESAHS